MSVQGPAALPPRFPELRPGRSASSPPATGAATAAPASRESSLWEVLTEEERSFFQQQALLGPLTYGKSRAAAAPSAPTGQRLDVRA